MPITKQNSTGYIHPDEPNLVDLHKALQYNAAGEPVVRTTVDGITLQAGDVIIDKVRVEVNAAHDTISGTHPVPVSANESSNSNSNPIHVNVTNGTLAVSGNVNVNNWPGTFNVNVNNWPGTQQVSGTVTVNQPVAVTDNNSSLTVDGTVSLSNDTLTALENINTTVSGTVELGSTTLSALENTTVTISGTPTVNIGTIPEVEIKNDSGNPLPISKNTATNTLENPIYVEQSNVATTSKDRMKITSYTTGFFNTFQHSKALDVWDESLTNGGNATHDDNRNAVLISVIATPGSKVIRQTRQVMRYIPGRPAEYSQAFIMGAHVSGIRIRIGQFDENDGFYLERSADGTLYAVIRSGVTGSPVETRIAQSSWNGDKLLNGTGPSGLTLDLSKTQLLVVDYEWYGTGAVQFSFVINNQTIKAHTFYHANVISDPWCSTPFIPMRIELENVSATTGTSMYQISSCHSMESFSDNLGFPLSIATPITGRSLQTQNTYYPIISIRLKSTALNSVVVPQYIQAGTLDNTFINYQLLLNATLTGANFVNHPTTESVVQYDISATSYTGGTVLNQGFAAAGYNDRLLLNENSAAGNFQIGRSSLGTVSDILTVVVAAGTSNKAGIAVMNWIEQR